MSSKAHFEGVPGRDKMWSGRSSTTSSSLVSVEGAWPSSLYGDLGGNGGGTLAASLVSLLILTLACMRASRVCLLSEAVEAAVDGRLENALLGLSIWSNSIPFSPASCFCCHCALFSVRMFDQGRCRNLPMGPEAGAASVSSGRFCLLLFLGGKSRFERMRSSASPRTVKVGNTM